MEKEIDARTTIQKQIHKMYAIQHPNTGDPHAHTCTHTRRGGVRRRLRACVRACVRVCARTSMSKT